MYDPRLDSVIIHPPAGSNICVCALSIAKIYFIQYDNSNNGTNITTDCEFTNQLFLRVYKNGLMNISLNTAHLTYLNRFSSLCYQTN